MWCFDVVRSPSTAPLLDSVDYFEAILLEFGVSMRRGLQALFPCLTWSTILKRFLTWFDLNTATADLTLPPQQIKKRLGNRHGKGEQIWAPQKAPKQGENELWSNFSHLCASDAEFMPLASS